MPPFSLSAGSASAERTSTEAVPFRQGQGAEIVGAVVLGEVAAHAPAPIASSAGRSARSA